MNLELKPPNMALQRTRRPRFRSGRSRCSLGSPLNARPLGDTEEHLTAGLAIMNALSKEKKMSIGSSVALFLICGFTALALAQAPPEPPKPGPEHKKLEYFLGKWTVESEIKANKYMPAGKGVSTETCTLGPGGFYASSIFSTVSGLSSGTGMYRSRPKGIVTAAASKRITFLSPELAECSPRRTPCWWTLR